MARDCFFTGHLDLGEMENGLILSIFVDVARKAKNRKG
jgi:hypothetical protein